MADTSEKQESKIIIRTGVPEDKPQVHRLAKQLHQKTVFADIPFSEEKFDRYVARVLDGPKHMLGLVAEYEGEIIGFAWASLSKYLIADDVLICTCHVIAVDTEPPHGDKDKLTFGHVTRRVTAFVRLLKNVKVWAKGKGAEHVMVYVTTGNEEGSANAKATDKLLKRMSATPLGGAYLI